MKAIRNSQIKSCEVQEIAAVLHGERKRLEKVLHAHKTTRIDQNCLCSVMKIKVQRSSRVGKLYRRGGVVNVPLVINILPEYEELRKVASISTIA